MAEANSAPHRKRVLICMGPHCNVGKRAARNARILRNHLKDRYGDEAFLHVAVDFSGCLSMCGAGPNWIVYPGEVVCNHIDDEEAVSDIIDTHLAE